MSTAAPLQNTAAQSPPANNLSRAGLLLQRKCACGKPASASLAGVCEACTKKRLQKKLSIGASNDPLEQEADRVAEQVLAAPARSAFSATPPRIQRYTGQATSATGSAPASVDRVLSGCGRPLESALQQDMGRRFGYDFSTVRVHTGSAAEQSAREVNAHAYTVGNNLVFGAGKFSPESHSGRKLIAHELTHVVQQSGACGSSVEKGQGGGARLFRSWDSSVGVCTDIESGRWLRKVVVEQETPQFVTLHWNDGALETAGCSTGKGHCCVDTPDGVACNRQQSRTNGSNCTPISAGEEYAITERKLNHNGWNFWNTFIPDRGIALHEYPVVDATPLSHGCVRLPLLTARHIFCGAIRNQTKVEVRGFARPRCSHPQLRSEWMSDITNATIPGRDGEDYRSIVRDGYGHNLTDAERAAIAAGTSTLAVPPRCPTGRSAAEPTAEERRGLPPMETPVTTVPDPARSGSTALVPGRINPSVPQTIIEGSGFEARIPQFIAALASAPNLASARNIARSQGQQLWSSSTRRAQGPTANTDDRALYWTRLEMTRALRSYQPRWTLSAANRDALLALFEQASRGMDTIDFGRRGSMKRILVSGFDPFGLSSISRGNPSGAAALSLDGQTLTAGSTQARVETVIFPVRFADFNAGIVESLFAPYLTGANRVDMVMTVSEGGSANFEVEEYAARRRTNEPLHTDNLGQRGDLLAPSAPLPPSIGGPGAPRTMAIPGVAAGPEFLRTTLPPAVRSGLRPTPLSGETEITEIPAGGTAPVYRPTGGPTPGSTAVEGSGGNFLSNEIFYRTRLLRDTSGSTVPMGHLHTPRLDSAAALGTPAFNTARDAIVLRIRNILTNVVPSL